MKFDEGLGTQRRELLDIDRNKFIPLELKKIDSKYVFVMKL